MDYLHTLFIEHSALQAIVVISLISAIGLMLGRIRVLGISLGITFVFFTGILAGHFGLTIDGQMLFYAETFGLVLFVYALGLQVGPGFFSSMRSEGAKLLLPAIGVLITGTLLAIALSFGANVAIGDMSGILCGATTNTPALAAAQQTLRQLGVDSSGAALSCALTYPLGVVGVIFAMIFLRKVFVKPSDLPLPDSKHKKNVFIASYCVTNPDIFGKTISDIHDKHNHFVISRMWHDGHVLIPMSDRVLQENDILLVITKPGETENLRQIFGKQEEKDWNNGNIDWNKIDSELTSQRIIVTRPEIIGKKLSSLRLRNNYGINISRVYRAEVQLLATPDLVLQLGDRLTVVGETADIKRVEKILGNAVKSLNEPNLVSVFIGMILGLMVGCIPLAI
ncbi:MAG: transporter, partial [Bacteroidaceae bacterium]|nr:transporter [Bacteroidaceae bacterium]